MRVFTDLHPKAQKLGLLLIRECAKQGISILIGECVRTIAEQDAVYAKGRTVAGDIVTNCRGVNYSSMHQWRIAFDIYLNMDIDGDGKTSDDAFNDSTLLFEKIGKIGQSIGLEWGGAWTSIKDRPHFQLPDWGSTPSKLKKLYGTPEKFMATWKAETVVGASEVKTISEHYYPQLGPDSVFVRLQKALGVPVGSSAEATLAKTITVQKGCSGTVVGLLQEYWKGLGLYTGTIDGDWGKLSDAAAYYCQLRVVLISKPDKIYSAKGKSWMKSLGL